jgi:hypothetical protein
MSAADLLLLAGKVFAAWTIGFSVGWSVTVLRSAASHV